MESGYYLMKDLLQSGAAFTAVFTYNDIIALGAFRAMKEAGSADSDRHVDCGL
jgi:DNA-binding LacI/PurR family transcriptional regulator